MKSQQVTDSYSSLPSCRLSTLIVLFAYINMVSLSQAWSGSGPVFANDLTRRTLLIIGGTSTIHRPLILPTSNNDVTDTLTSSSLSVSVVESTTSSSDDASLASQEYRKVTSDYAYSFVPPPNFVTGTKPLKTHLDEINFFSSGVKGYQVGITVDPVRISSLKEFGTPEEVAARVVLAELRRDGVFDVTLVEDPREDPISQSYRLHYLSKGKRGNQHYVCQIHITPNQKLYVVTGQCPESAFSDQEAELTQAVHSFRVIEMESSTNNMT